MWNIGEHILPAFKTESASAKSEASTRPEGWSGAAGFGGGLPLPGCRSAAASLVAAFSFISFEVSSESTNSAYAYKTESFKQKNHFHFYQHIITFVRKINTWFQRLYKCLASIEQNSGLLQTFVLIWRLLCANTLHPQTEWRQTLVDRFCFIQHQLQLFQIFIHDKQRRYEA